MSTPPDTNPAEIRKAFLAISLFVTVVSLLAGCYVTYLNHQFLQLSKLSEATLTDIKIDNTTDQIAYRPTFKFTAQDGKTYETASKSIFTKFDSTIGSKITIRYDPTNPQDLRIDSHFSLFNISGFIFFSAGVFLITFLILCFVKVPSTPKRI